MSASFVAYAEKDMADTSSVALPPLETTFPLQWIDSNLGGSIIGVIGLLVGLVGVVYGVLGYRKAKEAKKEAKQSKVQATAANYNTKKTLEKAEETIDRLREASLIADNSENEFKNIFDNHLLNPLSEYVEGQGAGGSISLLLSTPAYGYAVLGSDSNKLRHAIKHLDTECKLEIIFCSPDDHFSYWLNVLLWSSWWKINKQFENFAVEFAKEIALFLGVIWDNTEKSTRDIWVTRATTVRIFAFIPSDNKHKNTPDEDKRKKYKKAYVTLTDPFSFSLQQTGRHFKARSIPVIKDQIETFVQIATSSEEDGHSYFERIKICPYTGKNSGDICINSEQHSADDVKAKLTTDYILGRTHQQHLEYKAFSAELDVLLENSEIQSIINKHHGNSNIYYLISVIIEVLGYFYSVLTVSPVAADVKNQIRKSPQLNNILSVCHAIEKYFSCPKEDSNCHLEAKKAASDLSVELKKLDSSAELADTHDPYSKLKDEHLLRTILYDLLTSGKGESEYGEWQQNRVKADNNSGAVTA